MACLRMYGIARTRAFRAIWMAKELGLEYEHVPIETGPSGARKPEYLAINRPAARAAVKLPTEADAATPIEITRTIARMNRL
jgi:glutathione S-transferase